MQLLLSAIVVALLSVLAAVVHQRVSATRSLGASEQLASDSKLNLLYKEAESALLSLNDAAELWRELSASDRQLAQVKLSTGGYALHSACKRGMVQAARAMLLQSASDGKNADTGSGLGSRLNLQEGVSGHTCLSLAAYHGHTPMLHMLGTAGKRVLSSLRTADGYTPLHLFLLGLLHPPSPHGSSSAVTGQGQGDEETAVYTLIRLGSDVNAAVQVTQDTTLVPAVPEHIKQMEAALSCAPAPGGPLFVPTTALAMALLSPRTRHLVGPLLAAGARASGADAAGVTPLMFALAYNASMRPTVADLSGRPGVAATVSTARTVGCGLTHTHIAAAAGVEEPVLRGILNAIGNTSSQATHAQVRDTAGRTALQLALQLGHTHLVPLLEGMEGESKADTARALPALSCPTSSSTQRLMDARPRPLAPGPPPVTMPPDMVDAYTRCGSIEVGDMYVDDSRGGKGTHYKFGKKEMDRFLASAAAMARMPHPEALGPRGWLAAAMRQFNASLQGAKVVVFGSMQPIVETLALAYGAASVTAVEYNLLTYDHPSIRTVTPQEVAGEAAQHHQAYDVALSISSFDHDGLGRYGDPLCPDCDLTAMDSVATFYLRPGAQSRFFVTFPIGPDVVVWNLHRRYGRVRLPLMLHAENGPAWGVPSSPASATSSPPALWHIEGAVGWTRDMARDKLDTAVSWTKSYEPVWVLSPLAVRTGM